MLYICKKMFLVLCAILAACVQINADSIHVGVCPKVEPMKDFEMDQFLGKWHVIQESLPHGECKTINYTLSEKYREYNVIERMDFDLECSKDELWDGRFLLEYAGILRLPSRGSASVMSVQFPIDPFGEASYVVFDTDYENYAGVYMCNSIFTSRHENILILSKNPTLDEDSLNNLHEKLFSFGVDTSNLKDVFQIGCLDEENSPVVSIHQNTFEKNYWVNKFVTSGLKIFQRSLKLIPGEAINIVENSKKAAECFANWAKKKGQDIFELGQNLVKDGLDSVIDEVKPIFKKGQDLVENGVDSLVDNAKPIFGKSQDLVESGVDSIVDNVNPLLKNGKNWFNKVWNNTLG